MKTRLWAVTLAGLLAGCGDNFPAEEPPGGDPPPASNPDRVSTTSSAISTSAVGRIYFKQSGSAAFAVDTQGFLYTRGHEFGASGTVNSLGVIIKKGGVPLYGINASSTSLETLGQLFIANNFVAELVSTIPLPSDPAGAALVFKNNGTGRLEFDSADNGGSILISQFYSRGFGYRREINQYRDWEKTNLVSAFLALQATKYPGNACNTVGTNTLFNEKTGQNVNPRAAGGVSFFGKLDEIHGAAMVHGAPNFLPWHREMLNQLETRLREADPTISLPYWDWNFSPINVWTPDFLGTYNGYPGAVDMNIGEPWRSAGFYNPMCSQTCLSTWLDPCSNPSCGTNPCRQDAMDPVTMNLNPSYNATYPPQSLWRRAPDPVIGIYTEFSGHDDNQLIHDSEAVGQADQFQHFHNDLAFAHSEAHGYIGGTVLDLFTAGRDPMFFIMHANLNRLWAVWQSQPGFAWRLDVTKANTTSGIYGNWVSTPVAGQMEGIQTPFEPWADIKPTNNDPMYRHVRPYTSHCSPAANCTADPPQPVVKHSYDANIVTPALYDPLPG